MSKTQTKTTHNYPKKKPVRKEAEYQEFVRFTAIPRVFRNKEFGYNSDSDFAKKYKVNPSTLSTWKNDKNFLDEIKNLSKIWGRNRLPDVMYALCDKAIKDGGAAEVKLFLQYVDGWKENSTINPHYAAIKDLQDSNRRLFDEEAKKYKIRNKKAR
jgi:hypothetical protein